MTRKISAFGTLTGVNADVTADYIPIIDASVADASKNKKITLDELKIALGIQGRPPTTSLFSFTANATSATQSATYDAGKGLSVSKTDAGASSTDRAIFNGKAVPVSTPWTATGKIRVSPSLATEFVRAGLAIYNSSSGKLLFVGINNQSGAAHLVVMYFTALGTFSSSPYDKTILPINVPLWYRITDDGTNNLFYISFDDGVTFTLVATCSRASFFTADKVGVAIETFGAITVTPAMLVPHYDDPDFP